jgi:hypothetical protein
MADDQGQAKELSDEHLRAQLRERETARVAAFLKDISAAVKPVEAKHRMRLVAVPGQGPRIGFGFLVQALLTGVPFEQPPEPDKSEVEAS